MCMNIYKYIYVCIDYVFIYGYIYIHTYDRYIFKMIRDINVH